MDTFLRVMVWGITVGLIGGLGGFIGPMLLTPESNQGPLLGIFFTGPLGFILGLFIGLILEPARLARSKREFRRKRGLCFKCGYDLRKVEHEKCPECGAKLLQVDLSDI